MKMALVTNVPPPETVVHVVCSDGKRRPVTNGRTGRRYTVGDWERIFGRPWGSGEKRKQRRRALAGQLDPGTDLSPMDQRVERLRRKIQSLQVYIDRPATPEFERENARRRLKAAREELAQLLEDPAVHASTGGKKMGTKKLVAIDMSQGGRPATLDPAASRRIESALNEAGDLEGLSVFASGDGRSVRFAKAVEPYHRTPRKVRGVTDAWLAWYRQKLAEEQGRR